MDVETGKIRYFDNADDLKEAVHKSNGSLVPIDAEQMTAEQKKNMQVDLKDNKSPLGKLRLSTQQERNRAKRARRKSRGK